MLDWFSTSSFDLYTTVTDRDIYLEKGNVKAMQLHCTQMKAWLNFVASQNCSLIYQSLFVDRQCTRVLLQQEVSHVRTQLSLVACVYTAIILVQ